jgi:hypothetical protein
MSSFRQQVSSSIRILGWNRDASARATHLKAANWNVQLATIERKSMSTKTSIKRVALVAAAALTIGGFSAVSAHATTYATPFTVTQADAGKNVAAATSLTASGVAGAYNYVEITAGSNLDAGSSLGLTVTGSAAGAVTVTTDANAATHADTLTVVGNSVVGQAGNIYINGDVIRIATPSVGSFTVQVNELTTANGVTSTTALQTISVTVNTASIVGTISTASSFGVLVDTSSAYTPAVFANLETATLTSSTTDGTTPIYKGATGSSSVQGAVVAVRLLDTEATPVPLAGVSVSASIVGAGLIAGTGSNTDTYTLYAWASPLSGAASTTDAAGWAFFNVYNSGASGTGTITVSYTNASGVTTVVTTKSVVFYSSTVASIKVTTPHGVIPTATVSSFTPTATEGISLYNSGHGASTTTSSAALAIVAKDSNGNLIPGTDNATTTLFTVTSSAPAVATVGSGSVYFDSNNAYFYPVITPVSAGTTTITVVDAATGLVSGSAVITVSGADVNAVTPSTGASSYDPGTKVTYNLTIANAKGTSVPDGTYAQFFTKGAAPITSVGVQGTVSGESVTTVNGVAASTFYAPLQGGNVLITGGVLGASTTIFATALQSATLADATFSVNGSSDASAATDAANAATDAANAAADAADNATQAASEALAAVNSLATTVASLIAGIKAQITSLTNLITKIKNKVGA